MNLKSIGFLDEPRVDLDSLDDFELNGMVEIVG